MRRSITALVVALGVVAAFPTAAMAAETANCVDQTENRWRGQQTTDSVQKHGASARVKALVLNQCTNPDLIENSGTFYLSNVVPDPGGSNDIVQVGVGNCRQLGCGAGMKYYSAWGRSEATAGCSGFSDRPPTPNEEGTWSSAVHDYKVWHNNNEWSFYVDTTKVGWIGEASICWTPRRSMWFTETWDIGDQHGGTAAVKFTLASANYANAENGGFFFTSWNAANACNIVIPANAIFKCDLTSGTQLAIWTDR